MLSPFTAILPWPISYVYQYMLSSSMISARYPIVCFLRDPHHRSHELVIRVIQVYHTGMVLTGNVIDSTGVTSLKYQWMTFPGRALLPPVTSLMSWLHLCNIPSDTCDWSVWHVTIFYMVRGGEYITHQKSGQVSKLFSILPRKLRFTRPSHACAVVSTNINQRCYFNLVRLRGISLK